MIFDFLKSPERRLKDYLSRRFLKEIKRILIQHNNYVEPRILLKSIELIYDSLISQSQHLQEKFKLSEETVSDAIELEYQVQKSVLERSIYG